ncbi:hypothetical protein GCM10028801_45690 [Nocardioides maradonensis]
MSVAPEVVAAALSILEGDDSTRAAAALEEALHAYHPYEDQFEDLLEVLALYAPSEGTPYSDHRQLCDAIQQTVIGDTVGGAP